MTNQAQIELAADMAVDWWLQIFKKTDPEARDKFAISLKNSIVEKLKVQEFVFVENDYDPEGILLNAVHDAGFACRGNMFSGREFFPDKHELCVSLHQLEPKSGYGNWEDKIVVPKVGEG